MRILGKLPQGPAVTIGRPPPPAAPKSGSPCDRLGHSEVAGQDTACRHDRYIGGQDYGRRDITACPGWHNPAAFIGLDRGKHQSQATAPYPAGALPARPAG